MTQPGRLSGIGGAVGGLAGALRRRREEQRGGRVRLYDASGQPRTLDPDGEEAGPLLTAAAEMTAAVGGPEPAESA